VALEFFFLFIMMIIIFSKFSVHKCISKVGRLSESINFWQIGWNIESLALIRIHYFCNYVQHSLWFILNKKSPVNAKGNAQQRCMFESPVQTKSKLTHPINDVFYTCPRAPDGMTCLTQSYWLNIANFSHPPFIWRLCLGWPLSNLWKSFTDPETIVFQAADGEDLVILACIIFDWSTYVMDRQNCDG